MNDLAEKRGPGRPRVLSDEEREASRIRQNKRRSQRALARRTALRAAKAIAEGRVPGKPGPAPVLSDAEREDRRRASWAAYRLRNLERVRERDAKDKREERAERAIAEGREPGRIGRERVLTDAQRREAQRMNSRRWAAENPEKDKARRIAYYENHKAESAARVHKRRARIKEVGGAFTAADIDYLAKRQKGKCAFCLQLFGDEKPHIDHYMPLALGGSNDRTNLRLLHPTCNLSKGAKHPLTLAMENGLLCW